MAQYPSLTAARAAGLIPREEVDPHHRIRPDAQPEALADDTPVWGPESMEELCTRKHWKRQGRRVRAGTEPASILGHESPPVSLFAFDQTISEEEYQNEQREKLGVQITGWNRQWGELMRGLVQWRAQLEQTPPPEAEEALRLLEHKRQTLLDRRINLASAARTLGMEIGDPDSLPWIEAIQTFRQHRARSLFGELAPGDHLLAREVERQLEREERELLEPVPLLPYWKFFGRFHKELEKNRLQREAAHATRIREFHALFPAREMKRHFTLYLGPTNSGKTFQALRRMAAAESGIYLAPLRLLALEVAETLKGWDVPCHMITGEERIMDGWAQHTASTIEMLPLQKRFRLCIIDEAQMLGDAERGWAWTQAILGVMADEVCVVGAPESLPAIEKLLRLTGDPWDVVRLERLAPLHVMKKPVKTFQELEPGTAIIAFSRAAVLGLKDELEQKTGKPTAVLYGALPPEVRRQQAALFASGQTPFLAATDAIGMGLNLPIRTILFAQDVKHIDRAEIPLTSMEVRQIAGRAGRFGKNEAGFVGTFRIPLTLIEAGMEFPPAPIERAHLAPNMDHLLALADLQSHQNPKKNTLAHLFTLFSQMVKPDPEVYDLADLEDQTVLARITDRYRQLDLPTRFALSAAPVPLRNFGAVAAFELMVDAVARARKLPLELVLSPVEHGTGQRLHVLETAMRVVNLYCWLHYRFSEHFPDLKPAEESRRRINKEINELLTREKRQGGKCQGCGVTLPPEFRFPLCNICFHTARRERAEAGGRPHVHPRRHHGGPRSGRGHGPGRGRPV